MQVNDTVKLLRECDAGSKMAVSSIDDIIDKIYDNVVVPIIGLDAFSVKGNEDISLAHYIIEEILNKCNFEINDLEVTLLDTPGHVDFSAETERMLKVLDYAILVISGTDGVQSHTRTLWKLLKSYNIPTFIFVTKMDFARLPESDILTDLKELCGECIVDFSTQNTDEFYENIAVCDETVLENIIICSCFSS